MVSYGIPTGVQVNEASNTLAPVRLRSSLGKTKEQPAIDPAIILLL